MTVAEYALDTYLPNRPHNANSHEHVRSMIANHIVGTKLGSRRLGDVRTSEVRGWANERWEALSPSTAAKTLGLLRSVYAAAVEDRLLKVSPVTRSVKLPGRRSRGSPSWGLRKWRGFRRRWSRCGRRPR